MLTTVGSSFDALHQAQVHEARDELGDSRPRDPRPLREFGGADLAPVQPLQREVLSRRQRRVVLGKGALDPAADLRCDPR